MKEGSDCSYCGKEDSVNHTFIHFRFTQSFQQNVFNWFNSMNDSNLRPSTKESLFGISLHSPTRKVVIKRLNYTLPFMRFYIYLYKLHNKSLTLDAFVNQISMKYHLEKIEVYFNNSASSFLFFVHSFSPFNFRISNVHFCWTFVINNSFVHDESSTCMLYIMQCMLLKMQCMR